eukprot:6182830-Pyramimonas_sp.AAC.1
MVEPEIEGIYAAEDSTRSEDGAKPEDSDSCREAHQRGCAYEISRRGGTALRRETSPEHGTPQPRSTTSSTSTGRRSGQHPTVCIGASARTLRGQIAPTRSAQT